MDDQEIAQLVENQQHGYALTRNFYRDQEIYELDADRIFMRSWIYAGHQSEIPNPGDYLLCEFAGESVIIVRTGEDGISALINLCRYRGTRVCLEARGHTSKLVCP